MSSTPPLTCDSCSLPCVWVRCTQFAGDHFFCQRHAEVEQDFGKPDETGWHHDWYSAERYNERRRALTEESARKQREFLAAHAVPVTERKTRS